MNECRYVVPIYDIYISFLVGSAFSDLYYYYYLFFVLCNILNLIVSLVLCFSCASSGNGQQMPENMTLRRDIVMCMYR